MFRPLAPARTVLGRFPLALNEVLGRCCVPADWIGRELAVMGD